MGDPRKLPTGFRVKQRGGLWDYFVPGRAEWMGSATEKDLAFDMAWACALPRLAALGLTPEEWDEMMAAKERVADLERTLAFYADPDTYFDLEFNREAPCGALAADFGETPIGSLPGSLARFTLFGTTKNDDEPA